MSRNIFTNPRNNDSYDWEINHSDEAAVEKERQIEHGANTANTGMVKQQAGTTPMVLQLQGTILHEAQLVEMLAWFELCEDQTIHFTDFAGDKYEVIITKFNPTRHRTIRNPRDFANAPYWYWKYEMEMEVVTILDGVWEGVTP